MILQAPYLPEGFEQFWQETVAVALNTPLAFDRRPQSKVVREGFTIDLLDFNGVGGRTLHGWFAYPRSQDASPGFLWLPPYGRWSMPPNEYGTREGFCSMSFNHFGESAFHTEAYVPERGYFADGIESPQTWVFRRIFQDSVIAARVMESMAEVGQGGVGVMGLSQGGGVAIWLGALLASVKCVAADLPFGAARPIVFERPINRSPLKEVCDWMAQSDSHRDMAMRTMSFFDTVNLATLCRVPTLVTYGTKDPAVREYEVRSIFGALPGEKRIEAIEGGHDWHVSMVERNRSWLSAHL